MLLIFEALLLLLLLVLLPLVIFVNLPLSRRACRMVRGFPQVTGELPLIGHALLLFRNTDNLFWFGRKMFKSFGSRYIFTVLGTPSVNICDPQAAEAVLSNSTNIDKGLLYNFLKPWLGDGLLTSTGALWHSRRKLLTPAFHFRILGQFSEHLEQQAETLVQDLASGAEAGELIDVMPVISRATLRSIRVTAMGQVDFQGDSAEGEETYFKAIHRVGNSVVHRMCTPWLWPPIGFRLLSSLSSTFYQDLRHLHGMTEKVIAERKASLLLKEKLQEKNKSESEPVTGTKKSVQPFLDVLLSVQRNGSTLSDRDIREEVDTFMFEGHDTTAMALCWALELLGRHPLEQDALALEVRAASSDWESVSRLPYLDRVFKECLRLRPSVPFIARFLTSDITLQDGQVLPKHSGAHVHIYDLHRNPEHFPDPERFDPDRFLPDNEQRRHPFAYIPFSAGPRNCIGKKFAQMEVKLFLAAVVRSFVIRSAMSAEKPDFVADLVLRPKNGVPLKLTPRSSS